MSSTPTTPTPGKPSFSILNVLYIIIPVGLIAGGYYYFSIPKDDKDPLSTARRLGEFFNKHNKTAKMEEPYKDADGDLVADTPAETKKPEVLFFSGLAVKKPEMGPNSEEKTYTDFMKFLAEKTGLKVEYKPEAEKFEEQLAAFKEGKLHVSKFTTGQVAFAVGEAGFVPFAVPANAEGKFGHHMVILAAANSGITKPEELRGKKITYVGYSSNSGFQSAVITLKNKFNLLIDRDYEHVLSGTQPASIEAIASTDPKKAVKGTQAVVVASDLLERMLANPDSKLDKTKFKEIYRSEEVFPPACFGYAYNLDPELVKKIKAAFLEFKWEGTSVGKKYAANNWTKFVEIQYKKDWEPIRKVESELRSLASVGK